MDKREDMGRRLYEACLSGSVAELDALIEIDQLTLDRVNSFTCFFSDTPLHVATLRGHLDFVKALLSRKPKLAMELDSLRCSPLHLASTEGHVEIVRELLLVNTDVCLARDQDGRTPLHFAVIKGRVEVIQELLRTKPESIREKLDRGETVLHLCIKYNKLEALKTLIEDLRGNEFLLCSRDDDGNTILHLAAALKQMDTIQYLLKTSMKEHCTNVKNHNGSTALDVVEHCPNRDLKTMDIREFLLQAGVQRSICSGSDFNPESPPNNNNPPHHCGCKVLNVIVQEFLKYMVIDPEWLKEVRGHIITAATVTATMAYQNILSPPGGFWQENKEGHKAGEAIMDTMNKKYSLKFLTLNSMVLYASVFSVVLALSGVPRHNQFLVRVIISFVYFILSCMVVAYNMAMLSLFPSHERTGIKTILTEIPIMLLQVFEYFALVLVLCIVYHTLELAGIFLRRKGGPRPNNRISQNRNFSIENCC